MLVIVSGGQTGADRAALDAAVGAGIPYRGWCPKGGWAEDCHTPPGVLALYPNLRETPEAAPGQRTDWNVRDSDALVIMVGKHGLAASKGTERALAHARALHKPYIVVDVFEPQAMATARAFFSKHMDQVVSIGGPRESEEPGLYAAARGVLDAILAATGAAQNERG